MFCLEYWLERGLSPKEAKQRVKENVFGVGFKSDS
jgi:hypothetical protein